MAAIAALPGVAALTLDAWEAQPLALAPMQALAGRLTSLTLSCAWHEVAWAMDPDAPELLRRLRIGGHAVLCRGARLPGRAQRAASNDKSSNGHMQT